MKFWMIINRLDLDYARYAKLHPDDARPNKIYYYRDDAEDELIELKERHPGEDFFLLETIAKTSVRAGVIFIEEG